MTLIEAAVALAGTVNSIPAGDAKQAPQTGSSRNWPGANRTAPETGLMQTMGSD